MYTKEQHYQIDNVLEFIEVNLDQSLALEQLAKVSTYSPYHFQRLFKGIVGETPANYVKRLRLENAAHFLIYEHQIPITQIALMCGFSSLSYFTATFVANFQMSPKKWREGGYLERFPREYEDDSKKSKQSRKMEKAHHEHEGYNKFQWLNLKKVNTAEFPAFTAVKRQSVGPYTEGVPSVWEEIYRFANARDLVKEDTVMYGIPKNNPYITPPEKSRYDCLLPVNDPDKLALEQERIYHFRGGKHVIYEFDEPLDYAERNRLIECYSELYSFWLPKSGYKYLANPVELVEAEPIPGTLSLQCKIKAIALAIEPK
ncbi:AraC family transcriptional regulator [Bacillus haimaensis]|uniref:AraC family transcriptional regulator n=1 Tax=Bacillus haimaensis TaxID=3160967 RepID=UPI003AA96B4F